MLYLRPALRAWAQDGLRLAAGGGLSYLLRDDFTTAAAAPLTSPRTAEPGPGTLTITDTGNKMSVNGGRLQMAGNTASNNPRWVAGSLARSAGRTLVSCCNFSALGASTAFTWSDNSAGSTNTAGMYSTSSGLVALDNGTVTGVLATLSTATDYFYATALRATGSFHFVKGGAFGNWTLVWVSTAETAASLYPAYRSAAGAGSITIDTFRVLDLPVPFATDYGLATQRLAGARAAGDTFTHEADCVIEFVATTLPSASTQRIAFRMQNATNYWYARQDSDGRFSLYENVDGVATQRATAVGVLSSGHRIVVVADGTTIRGYSNNVLRWTYSSATNFATATAGELNALGTGGAVSDIVSWPRVLTGTAASLLDSAVA